MPFFKRGKRCLPLSEIKDEDQKKEGIKRAFSKQIYKRVIFKWFQLLLYKNILWGTFLKITCFWRLFLPKSLPENGDITFIQCKWLPRTLFKTMQRNPTKPVTPHGETRPFFFLSFLARKITFKYQTESINASIKFFFQEPGKWFVLFYRTGLKRVFLQSFCFIIKIIQGKWHDFFFRVFIFFLDKV